MSSIQPTDKSWRKSLRFQEQKPFFNFEKEQPTEKFILLLNLAVLINQWDWENSSLDLRRRNHQKSSEIHLHLNTAALKLVAVGR